LHRYAQLPTLGWVSHFLLPGHFLTWLVNSDYSELYVESLLACNNMRLEVHVIWATSVFSDHSELQQKWLTCQHSAVIVHQTDYGSTDKPPHKTGCLGNFKALFHILEEQNGWFKKLPQ